MRILLIEDDKEVAHFVKKGLKENSYAVDIATDGEEGFCLALHERYDIIILDIMLPSKDGYEIIKDLREKGITTPVIFLTAKDSTQDIVKGLDLGGDDYVVKPFSFAELLARIRALLRRGTEQKGSQLKVADLRVDLLKREVYRGNTKIELTPKEFALLEYMMRNAGLVLTRTMISEGVWDYNFDTFTNIVDVHINHLRKKIDKDFHPKLIHTIRGVGYVLKEGD